MKTNEMIPSQKESGSAQHFFLYLLNFFSLGFVAVATGNILFQIIDKFFGDQGLIYFDQMAVKFGIASIFIAGPILFLISRLLGKKVATGQISLSSKVRRWLTYIVLFITAAILIGDAIALVMNFLEGETTVSFLLKVLVIMLIAGSIFGYLLFDMQRKNGKRMQIDQVMRWAVTIIIALIFVSAFFVIDSPKVAKQKKIDTQTLNDVQNVDASINAYFAQTGSLPSSLDVLDKTTFSPGLAMQNIKYKIINGNRYQLCAEFKRSNFTDTEAQEKFLSQWKHEAGNYCFERITVSKGENVKGNFDNFIPAIPVK